MKLIRSRRVIFDGEVQPAGIFVRDGRIIEIVPYQASPENTETSVFDFGDAVVMPGLIDAHVHINEPGREAWEGFDTATKAAAAGGITLIADMPLNSSPVTTTADALHQKVSASEGKLHIDCCFYGGLIPGNEDEIPALIEAGVPGIKIFLCPSGLDEFPAATEHELRTVMPLLARHDIPLLVHAELEQPLSSPWVDFHSYMAFADGRPNAWEDEAIRLMIRLCAETNCRTHIVHVASDTGADLIAEAKAQGIPISCETAPHYLYFESGEIVDGDTRFKCAPPIRDVRNRQNLRNRLMDGTIDMVATDHSPCTPDLKMYDTGDFSKAWGGIASLQLLLPALWTAMKDEGASLPDLANWLSAEPARLLGMDSHRGKIAPGYSADFVVWEPETSFKVEGKKLQHRHPITPYEGRKLYGKVKSTFLRGTQIFDGTSFKNTNYGTHIALQKEHE